ncbi:G5 domain-containing protein [Bacillus sp. JJ1533]|uniref:G5 domain-containing protein n=1 Tax=Bacillus sp. JJ1533 TaxID=3122959 RepID=UPI002FFE45A0
MQKLSTVKIFSLLILCVLLLSLFSTIGTKTYHAFFADDSFKEKPGNEPSEEIENNTDQIDKTDDNHVVSQSAIHDLKDESEIVQWVKEFGVVPIPANKSFSLLSFLSESGTSTNYSNEALSIIATGIYSTILSSNFEIVERHISNQLPYYAAFGYEAMIEKDRKDLIIYNANPHAFQLMFSFVNHEFIVQLIGPESPQSIHIVIEEKESFEPKIIKQYDSTLSKGAKVVRQKGVPGEIGTIYRIIRETGVVDEKVKVAEDFYPPIHKIEAHSILVPEPPQNVNDTEPEGNIANPDYKTPGTNNGKGEENNQESGNESNKDNEKENTDLWEDPDPLHLQKS